MQITLLYYNTVSKIYFINKNNKGQEENRHSNDRPVRNGP